MDPIKRKLNWRPDKPDFRDFRYHSSVGLHKEPPPIVDLRPMMPPVVDQGDIGSCTGNAIAKSLGHLQLLALKAEGKEPTEFGVHYNPVSRLFIYYNERRIEGTTHSDSGAELRDGIKAIRRWGICREYDWPYKPENLFVEPSKEMYEQGARHLIITGYRLTSNSLMEMKSCLAQGFTFVFGIMVYDSFMTDQVTKTGIVPMPVPSSIPSGGHALCAVGYNDEKKLFTFGNSWGNWGDFGYGYLPYEYMSNPGLASDMWTIRR